MVNYSQVKMTNQMVFILLVKRPPQSQWTCQNELVQNDKGPF